MIHQRPDDRLDNRYVLRRHFEGILTADDVKQHIPHVFEAPPNSVLLDVHLRFAPAKVDGILNMLCLTLFDPQGFRGAGHRHGDRQEVSLSAGEATPGYQAGPLPAGRWAIEIDTHMIAPGEPCRYQLDIELNVAQDRETAVGTAMPLGLRHVTQPSARRSPGWYRGDLHTHSIHSDAQWDVSQLVEAARQHDLDFIALTDHNTVSGLPEMDRASSPDLLTMGGMELTTFWGHALCLGTRQWIDWRVPVDGHHMADIARQAEEKGQLFIIAHPCADGDPVCTGCDWRYTELQPGLGHLIEVWNGSWSGETNDEQALALWYGWLNQGYRLVATAGSDAHNPRDLASQPAFNVVYADGLAEAAILRAVRRGHLYLSSEPCLDFIGHDDRGNRAMMGDLLSGRQVIVVIKWSDCPAGATLRLVVDGRALIEWPARKAGRRTLSLASSQVRWCVVEVRDRQGQMLALTNPIFLSSDHTEVMDDLGRPTGRSPDRPEQTYPEKLRRYVGSGKWQ